MLKAAGNTQKQLNLVKLHEQSKKNLEQEIQNYKEEAQKQRKIIYQLEKERDRYINEASDLTQKVFNTSLYDFSLQLFDYLIYLFTDISCKLQVLQHMEDVKVREMQIFDYKKKIAEAETKLKQQQNLYEAVRSDRNLYSKNLIESQVSVFQKLSKFCIKFYYVKL